MVATEIVTGDGLAAMAGLPAASVDAIISDPPYGNTNIDWDTPVDWTAFWVQAERLIRPGGAVVLFACGKFTFELARTKWDWFRYKLVWVKDRPVGFLDANKRPMRMHEDVLVFGVGRTPVYIPQFTLGRPYKASPRVRPALHYSTPGRSEVDNSGRRYATDVMQFVVRDDESGLHPTQKPLALMKHLVASYCPTGGRVADPFCGSGSTGAAVTAIGGGRSFWGCERDPAMAEKARRRLASVTPELFGDDHGLRP